ncbi:mitochondrial ribonuclease P catalytic subunit [Euwallacea fornicatus]|uniref:mitochondrial ribonuclease P catalytic subunit n=1 Tax=Euwallacea fornicatus TaxID=995702 RepID=UPI00338D7B6A
MLLRNMKIWFFTLRTKYTLTLQKTPNSPKNINSIAKVRRTPEDMVVSALENAKIGENQNWDDIRRRILDQKGYVTITSDNIDGVIMASIVQLNRLDLAKSYLNYLNFIKTVPNLATIGKYFRLLYDNHKNKSLEFDEHKIIELCNEVRRKYPVLESRTLENIILALSLTSKWKHCFDIMREIKISTNVSTLSYSALASAAFRNKNELLAWGLLREAVSKEKFPHGTAYLSYLEILKTQQEQESIVKGVEKLFMFFKETELLCPEEVVNFLIDSFKLGQKTIVKFSGHCSHCKVKLENLQLTDEEFAIVQKIFFKNAIIGKDIFVKSNPEEMARFQKFISSMKKYDVILDGLNIAYSKGARKSPQILSRNLAKVVSHFVQKGKSVLVLGRVHMQKWPKNNWDYIKENASIFLTQDISQDDPYLLYCALRSGKDTIICTRDLMRGHKFLLRDAKYKILFNRWLTQRQYFLLTVNDEGKAFFRAPPTFNPVAQSKDGVWHVPYISEGVEIDEMYHKTWFCLNKI